MKGQDQLEVNYTGCGESKIQDSTAFSNDEDVEFAAAWTGESIHGKSSAPPGTTSWTVIQSALEMAVISATEMASQLTVKHDTQDSDTPAEQLRAKLHEDFKSFHKELKKLSFPWINDLALRLETLREAAEEEDPDNLDPLSVGSLRNLLRFLSGMQSQLLKPKTGLTPDGDIRIFWRQGARFLGVTFLSNGEAVWVASYPRESFAEKVDRSSGFTDVANLKRTIKEQARSEWVLNGEG